MTIEHDIENCPWCRGDGKDHGTLGMAQVRDCPRCEGSGRVYVTSRESATGRRRVYKGPAAKPGLTVALEQQQLTELLQKTTQPKRAKAKPKPRSKPKTKHAQRHAA